MTSTTHGTSPTWLGDQTAHTAETAVQLVTDRAALGQARVVAAAPVAVVMTMGALHAGHRALLREARRRAATVIATIFVNPLQFGPNEDYDSYPRNLAADLEMCANENVDLVFAPSPAVVYPAGLPNVTVHPGSLGTILEGAARPGHFSGVLTVVLKMLHLTQPDIAVFGEKDYQQLTLIRQLVRDTDLDVQVVGVPTVRESDGLARSSRNAYLSPADRERAVALSSALQAGGRSGADGASAVLSAAKEVLETAGITPDYLVLTTPELGPVDDVAPTGAARLLVAAKVGHTRLIDNMPVTLGSS